MFIRKNFCTFAADLVKKHMAGIDLYKEIVFGSADSTTAQRISDLEKQGKLRKIAPRLYTTNMKDSPEAIVRYEHYGFKKENMYDYIIRYS